MPKVFQNSDYCNARVILDCTERRVEKATSFRCQASTFSSYKYYNTAKGLVGISPNSAITFVPNLYAGRSTDRSIVQHSGRLKKLENGDAGMEDRGLDIEEYCKQLNVQLRIPPFIRGEKQLSVTQEGKSRSVAFLRHVVDGAIRHIKVFKVLSNTFSSKKAPFT